MFRSIPDKADLLFLSGFMGCLLLTIVVYWPGLSGPFMLDDGSNIGGVRVPNMDWDAVVYIVTHNDSGLLGRSVSMLSFVLTGLQYGLDPWGYKYHNLLLHLLNGLLLFRLIQNLLPFADRELDGRKVLLIAGVTTALWLLHPLLVSTVLYAVQRMTQLAVFFTLLALLAYVRARTTQSRPAFLVFGWVVFPLMGLLAALSKENGALLPLYLLIIEVFVFRTGVADLRANTRLRALVGVFVVLPIVVVAIALPFMFGRIAEYSGRTFTLEGRLLTEVHVIFFYMQLIFLPRIRAMSLFHDDYPVTVTPDLPTLLLLLVLAGIGLAVWKVRKQWPVLAFGIAWFFVSHLMESTIFPLELVFEHRNYLASAGLILAPVYVLFKAGVLRPVRWICPLFIAMFAFMTAARAVEWGNDDVFHQIAVEEHPNSGRALNTYANYLLKHGDYEGTLRELDKLAVLTPEEPGVQLHRQSIKCAGGIRDEAALQRAGVLFEQYPLSVYGYNSLQNLISLVMEGHCSVVKIEDVEPLLTAAIAYAEARDSQQRLPYLIRLRGLVAMYKGYYAQGYSDFRTAQEALNDVTLLHELMRMQLERGEIGDAEETMALMEQQNEVRFGIDEHQLKISREMLAEAKRDRERAVQAALRAAERGAQDASTP